jgi:RNA polymerase sigma-70 factor (ECF subfamily)
MTVPAHHLDDDDYRSEADFESFFERWYPSVLSYSRRFGATYAEEVAQETLFRAFNCFADLRRDMPLPWLRTVARNVACDLHRAGKRLWPLPEAGEADPMDLSEGPEESLLRLERVRHMRAALGDISAEDRRLLHMLVIDQSSVEDVADRLAVTANTVRVRLHRARRRLGSHYMRRAGTHALALPALGLAALRRLIRPTTGTATRSAPALAAVAVLGGLTAATVVLSQPGVPQHTWSAAATDRGVVVTHVAAATRPPVVSSRTMRPVAHSSGTGHHPSAPVADPPVKTHVRVSDPSKPGTWTDTDITVQTPFGPFRIWTKTVRSEGDSVYCKVTHQKC